MSECEACATCGALHPLQEPKYEVRGNAEGWYVGIIGGQRVTRYLGSRMYAADVLFFIGEIGGHGNLDRHERKDLER
jgi:hypothetical protein